MPASTIKVSSWFFFGLLTPTAYSAMGQSCESSHADHDHPSQQAALAHNTSTVEQTFSAQNDAAMGKMMTDVTIRPSGDTDRDFVPMLVPHHQVAIDMAMASVEGTELKQDYKSFPRQSPLRTGGTNAKLFVKFITEY